MPDSSLPALVATGLREIPVVAPPDAIDRLVDLAELVFLWGKRLNLTGHRSPEAIVRRLVLDAAALLGALPSFASVADLGAGAGFPGLPIAILRPESRVFLVEARERRHHFQRQVIRELGLTNVGAIRGRFEEVEPTRCDLVVAQAVAAPQALAVEMCRWATPGATLAVPGGALPRSAGPQPRLESATTRSYALPLGGPVRTIWIARAL